MLYLRISATGRIDAATKPHRAREGRARPMSVLGISTDVTIAPFVRVSAAPPSPRSAKYDRCSGLSGAINPPKVYMAQIPLPLESGINRGSDFTLWTSKTRVNFARTIAVLVVATMMVRVAWIGDDALITLRTALNLSHGWGPGFNATESVQAYTHPLWFLLWLGVGTSTGQWIGAIFALSVTFSVLACVVVFWACGSVLRVTVTLVALVSSSAFIEYSSSGLENPLAYLLVALTVVQSRRVFTSSNVRILLFGLTVAGVLLTRLDLVLLIAIPCVFAVWPLRHSPKNVLYLVIGIVTPVAVWEIWSWINYATLLPNTVAAKSNLRIPKVDLVLQGLHYLQISSIEDWGTPLVILICLIIIFLKGKGFHRAWALGVVTYLAYVVYIGGDFMVGRFLAIPVLCCVVVADVLPLPLNVIRKVGSVQLEPIIAAGLVILTFCGLLIFGKVPTAIRRDTHIRFSGASTYYGIADERGVYVELRRSLHAWLEDRTKETSPYIYRSTALANPWVTLAEVDSASHAWPKNDGARLLIPNAVGEICWLGAVAVTSGPHVHWIDTCALSDRFLAESPFVGENWRIGHFKREVPKGYVEAVASNDASRIADSATRARLESLWEHIRK